MIRKCVQCGKEFTLSESEIKFFKSKNLALPKRCPECRKQNKANRNNKNNNSDNNVYSEVSDNKDNIYGNIDHNNEKKPKKNLGIKILSALLIALLGIFGFNILDGNIGSNDNQKQQEQSKDVANLKYSFRNENALESHYAKHVSEFDYSSKEEYLAGANKVIESTDALHKNEAEDNDDVYYLEDTNEFVIVSTDGYIRTYFKPSDGIDYYNRQ